MLFYLTDIVGSDYNSCSSVGFSIISGKYDSYLDQIHILQEDMISDYKKIRASMTYVA